MDDLALSANVPGKDGSMRKVGVVYLPGLEAVRTPLLLHERHVGLEVVVHVEVGSLLVEHYTA